MDSTEFSNLSRVLGEKHLEPLGYIFDSGDWHLSTNEFQVSYILGKEKNASQFKVKYLTVAMAHMDIHWAPRPPTKNKATKLDRNCPIQISPIMLKSFVESNYSSDCWHYENPHQNPRHSHVYLPIYYGGAEKNIVGKIKSSKFTQKQIELFQAKLITESECVKLVEKTIIEVSQYAKNWAQYFTPPRVLEAIKEYGQDWWLEKEWIGAYESKT